MLVTEPEKRYPQILTVLEGKQYECLMQKTRLEAEIYGWAELHGPNWIVRWEAGENTPKTFGSVPREPDTKTQEPLEGISALLNVLARLKLSLRAGDLKKAQKAQDFLNSKMPDNCQIDWVGFYKKHSKLSPDEKYAYIQDKERLLGGIFYEYLFVLEEGDRRFNKNKYVYNPDAVISQERLDEILDETPVCQVDW